LAFPNIADGLAVVLLTFQRLNEQKDKMRNRRIVSLLALIVLSTVGMSAQAQRPAVGITDHQVSVILQRLDRSSNKFRNSLNLALVNGNINETRPQNDINTFEPAFASALDQLRDRFTQRQAWARDVQDVLQKASVVNGFMMRNRLNVQAQNDWAVVLTDLNALANAYGVSWNQSTPPQMISSRSLRLSESDLNQLIRRITAGGDSFRSSLTAAFDRSSYNQPESERNMLVAAGYLRVATDRLRNQFDLRQPLAGFVAPLLTRATPIDTYMSNNQLTPQAQTDWSTLRGEIDTLAGAYNLSTNWRAGLDPRIPRH